MTTTTTQLTADQAAEKAIRGLQKQCVYLDVVGEFFDEYYRETCTVWLAGQGTVLRIDHGAHSLAWEIREVGREPRWGTHVTRDETAVAKLLADMASPN